MSLSCIDVFGAVDDQRGLCQRPAPSKFFHDIGPRSVRQAHVEHDDVRTGLPATRDGLAGGRRVDDMEPVGVEHGPEDLGEAGIVLDDEH